MSKLQMQASAKELAALLRQIEDINDDVKAVIGNAKDSGINVKALRAAAREIIMDSEKRAKKYDDENQLCMFRDALGLTGSERVLEAAE